MARRNQPGRPRHTPKGSTELSPRDQILNAAARLFVDSGFAKTSTREIADEVGIRQASLYYHFAGKDEILAALLEKSVRPTIDMADDILALVPPDSDAAALYLLAVADVATLAEAPHNIGSLYRMPDVMKSPAYESFEDTRAELVAVYDDVASGFTPKTVKEGMQRGVRGALSVGSMLLQSVEGVITTRRGGDRVDAMAADAIGSTCLRICQADDHAIEQARTTAAPLLESLYDKVSADTSAEAPRLWLTLSRRISQAA